MIYFEGKLVEYITYPNGEFGIKNFDKLTKDFDPYGRTWNVRWETDKDYASEFLALLAFGEATEKFCYLTIDYLPLSREDKTEYGRIDFFRPMLDALNEVFLRVMLETKHCVASDEAEFNHPDNEDKLSQWQKLNEVLKQTQAEGVLIIYPDKSAHTRHSKIIEGIIKENRKYHKFLTITAMKKRDKQTGKILDTLPFGDYDRQYVKDLKPQLVIIVDDIVSFGGTFKRVVKDVDLVLGYHPYTILSVYGNEMQPKDEEFNKLIDEVLWEKNINFN